MSRAALVALALCGCSPKAADTAHVASTRTTGVVYFSSTTNPLPTNELIVGKRTNVTENGNIPLDMRLGLLMDKMEAKQIIISQKAYEAGLKTGYACRGYGGSTADMEYLLSCYKSNRDDLVIQWFNNQLR